MAEAKQYKVRLSKKFHGMTAEGTRLTAMRHTRGGVTLSLPDNAEYVGPLDKDQLEAIKNDPAFEVTSVKADESSNSGSGTGGSTSKPAANSTAGQGGTPAPETTTPPQGDGSGTPEGEGQPADGQGEGEGSTPASELPEATGDGAGEGEGEGSQDGPAHLDEAALKALKKGNRDNAVAAAEERGVEVADTDTKAQIVDKIAEKQSQPQE